ncbi:MAG: alpha/beta fold hydrolase [Dehalococcoidia bacterium]
MPLVTVNGRKAHYSCPNPLSDRKGKVVLLVHGARGNHKVWLPQIEFLVAEHTPIAIDLPGHGDSEGSGSTRVAEYRDFVRGFVEALGISELVMAGHSMGGSIALDYTLHCPGVKALIPVGSSASWEIPEESIELWRTNPEKAKMEGQRRNFAKNTPESIVELNARNNAGTLPLVAAGDLEACSSFDVLASLDKIDVPTCIICGVEDAYAEGSRILHSKIAGSRLEWVEDAGHFPTIEQPEVTKGLLRDFLNSLP